MWATDYKGSSGPAIRLDDRVWKLDFMYASQAPEEYRISLYSIIYLMRIMDGLNQGWFADKLCETLGLSMKAFDLSWSAK